jgi:branched-chain amino acid transport system ATP-binding protein
VLLIDHNMTLVMSVCDRIVVLDQGRTLADGTPAEIRGNLDVAAAYLGETAIVEHADD